MTACSQPVWPGEGPVSRRQARRLSRRFAGVGVPIPGQRLMEIATGRPATADEAFDVGFALTATRLLADEHRAKRVRAQRRCLRWLMIAAATVVALNLLLCLGLVMFALTQHISPY